MDYNEILKKYRLYYTLLTDQTSSEGIEEFPVLPCYLDVIPNYLCLYGNPKDYNITDKTCVCFYQFDEKFDGKDGLFNAIYYNDIERLNYFKNRFKDVKMVIEPDYSQVRDIELIENKYRQFKARIVGLWFVLEMNIAVIPNLNYASERSFDYMLDGIKDSKMIAVSLKGILDKPNEEELLIKAVKYLVDNSKIEKIIVFTTGIIDDKVDRIFAYAKENGVEYFIPDNSMRIRNKALNGKK